MVDDLIDALGTVSLEGSENCFADTVAAREAYDALTEADKEEISEERVQKLEKAEEAYETVVQTIINEIDEILPLNRDDMDTKYNIAKEHLRVLRGQGRQYG